MPVGSMRRLDRRFETPADWIVLRTTFEDDILEIPRAPKVQGNAPGTEQTPPPSYDQVREERHLDETSIANVFPFETVDAVEGHAVVSDDESQDNQWRNDEDGQNEEENRHHLRMPPRVGYQGRQNDENKRHPRKTGYVEHFGWMFLHYQAFCSAGIAV